MTHPPTAPDDLVERLDSHRLGRTWAEASALLEDSLTEIRNLRAEITRLRAQPLAAYPDYLAQDAQSPGQPVVHASDCAIHRGPAYPPGPCDCGAQSPGQPQEGGEEAVHRVCRVIKGECENCPEMIEHHGERFYRACYLQAVECINTVETGNPWRKTENVKAPWIALAAAPSPALTDGEWSDEQIERAARAIHAARYKGPDHQREPEPFIHAVDIEYCTRLARAALAEIGGLK